MSDGIKAKPNFLGSGVSKGWSITTFCNGVAGSGQGIVKKSSYLKTLMFGKLKRVLETLCSNGSN